MKSGTAKVVSATIQAVVDGAQATIHFVTEAGERVVTGLIRATEQAILLVQGIFNTIATAIERVIEAISFLFDWGKILDLHNRIRTEITAAWEALRTGANGVSYDTIKAMIYQQLGTVKDHLDAALRSARTAVGSQSVIDLQKQASEASGQPKPVIGSCQSNWLAAKTNDNIIPSLPTGPSRATRSPRTTVPDVVWPQFQPSDEVLTLFNAFLTALATEVTDDVKETIDRLQEDLNPASRDGLVDQGLSVIIDTVQGLVDVAIDLGKATLGLLMDLLKAIMAAVYSTVMQEIQVPYVSDLYEWATGSKLTLLDMFSLIVAIPAAFAMGLISREPAYASGVSPLPPAERARRGLPRDADIPLPVGWGTIVAGCAQVW